VSFEIDDPIVAAQATHQLTDSDVDRVDPAYVSSK
jgi:hypothetical protein